VSHEVALAALIKLQPTIDARSVTLIMLAPALA
jgi:hypothetical protein